MKMHRAGFTLLEIMVVVVIIAVLIGLAIPAVLSARRSGGRATCLMNMRQIGMALIAYRQDTGAYPAPGKAIGALAEGYPRQLAKIPTCPRDPEDHHDTYGELYNFWGYALKTSPTPVADITEADGVYQPIQNLGAPSSAEQWLAGTMYGENSIVQYKTVAYISRQSHVADETNVPYDSTDWKDYWDMTQLNSLWTNGHPDSDFPGLVNPNAPSRTIVTICTKHVNDIHNYLVLRLSGETESVPPQKDKQFWTLSNKP